MNLQIHLVRCYYRQAYFQRRQIREQFLGEMCPMRSYSHQRYGRLSFLPETD